MKYLWFSNLVILIIIVNCTRSNISEDVLITESPKEEYKISDHEILIKSTSNTPLALLSGISVTAENNIYLLDHTLFKIYKFDTEGNLLDELQLVSGRGPGEFQHPISFSATDKYFYFFDQKNLRFTITDNRLKLIHEFQPINNALNNIIYPLKDSRFLVARNAFRLKSKDYSCFIYDIEKEKIVSEFDNSYEIHSTQPRHNSALNDMVFSLYSNRKYYVVFAVPFVIKVYNKNKELVSTHKIKNQKEVNYVQNEEFLTPDLAHIGFSYNKFHNLFLSTSVNPINNDNFLYIFDKNLTEIQAVINLNTFKKDKEEVFQILMKSNDTFGNIYLISNSGQGPKVLKLTLQKL